MSDEKDETKSATPEAPVVPNEAKAASKGKSKAKAHELKPTLPVITKEYINRDTMETMTLAHDPNTGIYEETRKTVDGKVTKTTHAGISHAWGKFEEVKK